MSSTPSNGRLPAVPHLECCPKEDTDQHEALQHTALISLQYTALISLQHTALIPLQYTTLISSEHNNLMAYVMSTPMAIMKGRENVKLNNIAKALVYESGNVVCQGLSV